jgi:hypothetical protein
MNPHNYTDSNRNESHLRNLVKVEPDIQYSKIISDCEILKSRKKSEISGLKLLSVINLLVGFIVALGALVLIFTISSHMFTSNNSIMNSKQIIFLLFLKLFVYAVALKVVFFFLGLYKSILKDIRDVQNDFTNLEFKIIAMHVAVIKDDNVTLSNILAEYSKSNCNKELKEEGSNLDLGNESVESKNLKDILKSISNFFST